MILRRRISNLTPRLARLVLLAVVLKIFRPTKRARLQRH